MSGGAFLALVLGSPSACASRSAHVNPIVGSLRREVLAPSSHLLWETLLGDLFLSPRFQLGRSVSRLICRLDTSSHWRQLLLLCMLFARQLRFTSPHHCLNLVDSGGPSYVSTLCTLTCFSTTLGMSPIRRSHLLVNGSCIFPNAWPPPIRAAVSVSSTSARTSKRWERDRDLVLVCHQTFASRAVLGSSRWVQLSWIAKRLYCGPIVVGIALSILAHKLDAKLRSSPSLLASAGLYDSWPMLCKRCNDLRRRVL